MSILENMYKASFLIAKYPKENAYRTIPSRTNGPVNAHLISWPKKAQNIQNLENMVKK